MWTCTQTKLAHFTNLGSGATRHLGPARCMAQKLPNTAKKGCILWIQEGGKAGNVTSVVFFAFAFSGSFFWGGAYKGFIELMVTNVPRMQPVAALLSFSLHREHHWHLLCQLLCQVLRHVLQTEQ